MTGLRHLLAPRYLLALAVLAAAAFLVVLDGGTSSGQEDGTTPQAQDATKLRCFGAASRDPERRCINKELRYTVVPTPEEAKLGQNSACRPSGQSDDLYPCFFGVAEDEAVKTIALVGDSHASHLRAALEVVANRRSWQGISMAQTGCPLTRAIPILRGKLRDDCVRWNDAVIPWFERHPEIEIVFVSSHGGSVVVPEGSTVRKAQRQGFRRAFAALPKTVKHIVVLRDTPWSSGAVPGCVDHAMAAGKRLDTACTIPRRRSVRPDYAAEAASRDRTGRVQLVDLTDYFCDAKVCFPVVGGALTHKDGGHITQVFSRTLGPYLGRAVDRLGD